MGFFDKRDDGKEKQLSDKEIRLNDQEKSLNKQQSVLQEREGRLAANLKAYETDVDNHLKKCSEDKAEIRAEQKTLKESKAEKLRDFPSSQLELVEKKRREIATYLSEQQDKIEEERKQVFEGRRALEKDKASFKEEQLQHLAARESETSENYESVTTLLDRANAKEEENREEAQRLSDLDAKLGEKQKTLISDQLAYESEKADFELKLAALESEFRKERKQQELQLEKRKSDFESGLEKLESQFKDKLAAGRSKRIEDLDTEIKSDRESRLKAVSEEIESLRGNWITQRETEEDEIKKNRGRLSIDKGEFEERYQKFLTKLKAIESAESELRDREQNAKEIISRRRENFDAEVAEEAKKLAHSENETLKAQLESKSKSYGDALESIKQIENENGKLKLLEKQFNGRSADEVLGELKSLRESNKNAAEVIASGNTEAQKQYRSAIEERDALKEKIDEKNAAIENMKSSLQEHSELNRQKIELERERDSLNRTVSILELENKEATEELNRLRASYESPEERENRIEAIVRPPRISEPKLPEKSESNRELVWLKNIHDQCTKYGFDFNPRIIKAFHTALKTSELSPVTVLAGVSGTGKSELPRLYSHFGGFYFEPLAVQPNWDSQESMLGFYNSIDNKFDAQPALKFLAQSQRGWEEGAPEAGYPGLQTAMSMVLLDEMNLAHPELYFAEFLSKFELRRGKGEDSVPCLNVKLGAGVDPYELPLGRNVLWAGTMNQDETTKSLSDKVLDRSIIIHFPRPKTLASRTTTVEWGDENAGKKLHRKQWEEWINKGSLFKDETGLQRIKPYKDFLEKINGAMSHAGRAVGHRVWQSVETYLSNHPDVQECIKNGEDTKLAEAMHFAFEDQLVQKVMPKIRGIETRGRAKEKCLDEIRGLLAEGVEKPFDLDRDFEIASTQGYGQFMWQSAEYLSSEDSEEAEFDNLGLMQSAGSSRSTPNTSVESAIEIESQTKESESDEQPKKPVAKSESPASPISSEDLSKPPPTWKADRYLSKPPPTWKPDRHDRLQLWNNKSDTYKRIIITDHSQKD